MVPIVPNGLSMGRNDPYGRVLDPDRKEAVRALVGPVDASTESLESLRLRHQG